jgi:hypothetical protein
MLDQTLEAYRNSRSRWDMQILDNGVAVNITGGTIILTAKYDPKDADPGVFQLKSSVSGEITVTNASLGQFTTTLAASKTSSLPNYRTALTWDLKYIDSSGNPDIVGGGAFIILPNITDATS